MELLLERQVSFARGMNNAAAPTEFRPDEVELLVNGRVSFNGQQIEPRGGSQRSHSAALNSGAQGYGGTEFYLANGDQQLVVFVGDKMYYSTNEGSTWTQGATGLATAYWSLTTFRQGSDNLLICANGTGRPYKWDGTTWTQLTNAPSGTKYVATFNQRVYYAGADGTTVTASQVRNCDVIAAPDGFTVQAETHDGDEIRGLFQLGGILLVFKRQSTGYIQGFGYQTLQVETGPTGVSRSVGCISFRSIAAAGDQGVCWLSERGFEFYQIGAQIQLISRPIQAFMDEISWSTLISGEGIPTATYWSLKNEYFCAIPSASGQNDYTFRWRPPTNEAPPCIMLDKHATADEQYTLYVDANGYLDVSQNASKQYARIVGGYLEIAAPSQPGLYVTLEAGYLDLAAVDHDHAVLFHADRATDEDLSAPWAVGYDGFVRKLEYGTVDNAASDGTGGVSVRPQVRSRPFVYGDQMRLKQGRVARIQTVSSADATVNVTLLGDGRVRTTKDVTVGASAGQRPISTKTRTSGRGHALQIEASWTDDVTLGALEIGARPLRESW